MQTAFLNTGAQSFNHLRYSRRPQLTWIAPRARGDTRRHAGA